MFVVSTIFPQTEEPTAMSSDTLCNVMQFLEADSGWWQVSKENAILMSVVIFTAMLLSIVMGVLMWLIKVLSVLLYGCLFNRFHFVV